MSVFRFRTYHYYLLCLSVFGLALYIAFYSSKSMSSLNFDYSGLIVDMAKNYSPPIRITLWTGSLRNPENNWYKKIRLKRLEGFVNEMNREMNDICRAIQMDEKGLSKDDVENESSHCEFFLSPLNETAAEGDAIAFFMFGVGYTLNELPKQETRKPEQIWVMYAREAPVSKWKDPLNGVFNWTMSYRRDSDIWAPYGKFVHRKTAIETKDFKFPGDVNMAQWISGKSKLIAGVISNCHTDSLREKLIRQMNKTGTGVDLYGTCGRQRQPFACERNSPNCTNNWKDLARQYKFYMAFENSLCTDYITEKFWRALDLGMVPVTYGGGNYELEAPPDSYINVRDFNSAKDLMQYLHFLDRNAKEYAKYFEWRAKYKLKKDWDKSSQVDWCYLCRDLKRYKREGAKSRKTYKNLQFWWSHQPYSHKSACINKPKNMFVSLNT